MRCIGRCYINPGWEAGAGVRERQSKRGRKEKEKKKNPFQCHLSCHILHIAHWFGFSYSVRDAHSHLFPFISSLPPSFPSPLFLQLLLTASLFYHLLSAPHSNTCSLAFSSSPIISLLHSSRRCSFHLFTCHLCRLQYSPSPFSSYFSYLIPIV